MICEYCNLIICQIAAKSHGVWMQHNHGNRGFFVNKIIKQTDYNPSHPSHRMRDGQQVWANLPSLVLAVSGGPNVPNFDARSDLEGTVGMSRRKCQDCEIELIFGIFMPCANRKANAPPMISFINWNKTAMWKSISGILLVLTTPG